MVPPACKGPAPVRTGERAQVVDAGPKRDPELDRRVSVYAAVIRRLVEIDHTYGGADPGFRVVYVIDGAVPGAEDPNKDVGDLAPSERFDADLKDGLKKRLEDLPPLRFVADRDLVIRYQSSSDPLGRVINDGALITLGPIRSHEKRLEVGHNLWISGLAGLWQTYVLSRDNKVWGVSGTTGPSALS